ncbi:UNVERIFIED_CONTAM: hypothetical protein Sangu_0764700 [Sesamum angustifolium]|uniref:At2g35280-like TPR domain-containing protein n=1 Tax=Sesamum angustifolium TaxID=2727405 RepID=A0AAW2PUN7_9LAMI
MSSILDCIPKELLTDILARVATSSLNNYFNVKLSCKMLKEVAECSNVYNCISLDEFPVAALHDMNEDARRFMNRCVACENLDALYMWGMVEYFSCDNLATALTFLNKSASLGHVGAYYIITIILLLSGKDYREKGVTLLGAMKISGNIEKRFLETNALALVGNVDDSVFCDACTCDRELSYIFEGI